MIVFCTTCKGRVQHIEETLPANIDNNRQPPSHNPRADMQGGCKFLVLDYNSSDYLSDYLSTKCSAEIALGNLVVYSLKQPGPFRMAHAKNMAHRLGIREGGDILVNLDADNLTGPNFAAYLAQRFAGVGTFTHAYGKVYHEAAFGDSKEEMFLWAKMIQGKLPKGISGRIAVTARQFLNSGGYNERYSTWGPDDFQTRLCRMGYLACEIAPEYLQGVLHNNRMRFKEYPEAQTLMGEEQFHQEIYESDNTVVNFGHIGEGIVFRNFDFSRPIKLGPIPTRIFGIGLHKTATTSLNKALKVLGVDSAHWKSAHWAKAIWEEMSASGKSPTLERSYALCDLPIPLLYRQLDTAYPGSKFILTIRDEEEWIESVQKHWSRAHNPFRGAWDTDPFTHRVHKLLYGRKDFDAETFLARYRKHNAEVLEYFQDRPADLLVMDMSRGDGWPELCAALGKPTPSVPYPRAFATRQDLTA